MILLMLIFICRVVAGTIQNTSPTSIRDPFSSQRQLLLSEGNNLAEAWGAPPIIEAVFENNLTPKSAPPDFLLQIFTQVYYVIPSYFLLKDFFRLFVE